MFCDIVGWTGHSAELDPEELRDITTQYRQAVVAAVAPFEGEVAQFLGDGVLLYFGYPHAHEDDAERAVRTAMGIITAVGRIETSRGSSLQARAGIATGLVVASPQIGAERSGERLVLGQTPNLAAWLQAKASPGGVVIAASTRQLLGRRFNFRVLEPIAAKGNGTPIEAFEVLGEVASFSRFEALRRTQLTPFVGRESETQLLRERWRAAAGGRGSALLISGEAGIGKSRLALILAEDTTNEHRLSLRCSCSPFHTDTALFPAISLLSELAGVALEDHADLKAAKIEGMLQASAGLGIEDSALITRFLIGPASGQVASIADPREYKIAIIRAIVSLVERIARERPLLLQFEDLHWVDATSLELLAAIVDRLAVLPVLLVLTFRAEYQCPLAGLPNVQRLLLSRLDAASATTLVRAVPGAREMPAETIERILKSAEGVPIFLEELTIAVVESLAGEAASGDAEAPTEIPHSLQASLVARLDHLGPAKTVVQIGSVIGRNFALELLRAVAPQDNMQLQEALDRVTQSGLLLRNGEEGSTEYTFKHALICDAAYDTLLKSRRKELHAQVATAIESKFPDLAAAMPELLAHHYARAEMAEPAIAQLAKAAQRASDRSASVEAASHVRRAQRLLQFVPAGIERDRQELELLCVLAPALASTVGHAADETCRAYEEARALMERTGDCTQRDAILIGLTSTYNNRAAFRESFQVRTEMLAIAKANSDATGLCAAHRGIASLHNIFGNFGLARDHGELASALYDAKLHGPQAWRFVHDLGVATASQLAIALWHLGEFQRSRQLADSAVDQAYRLQHANSIGYAHSFAGILAALLSHDQNELARHAQGMMAIKEDRGSSPWGMWGRTLRFIGLLRAGAYDQALVRMAEEFAARDQMQNRAVGAAYAVVAAEIAMNLGQYQRAQEACERGRSLSAETGERWMDAELSRVQGEAALALDSRDLNGSAECLLRRAIAIADEQGSCVFALRATTSLARLRHSRGEEQEARIAVERRLAVFAADCNVYDLRNARSFLASTA